MLDEVKAIEEELTGIRALPQLSVDPGFEVQRMRVPYFICRGDPRTQGAVGIPGFAHRESRHSPLPIPDTHVIRNRIPSNDLSGTLLRHMPAVTPNDDGEFPFIIELLGRPRQVDVSVWAVYRSRLLIEDHGHFGCFIPGFRDVIFVIETNGENFGWP